MTAARLAFASSLLALVGCGLVDYDSLAATFVDGAPGIDAPMELGDFTQATQIEALASSSDDDDPTLTVDLLEIYFASKRPGAAGGSGDLWWSIRTSTSGPWPAPEPVTELNSSSNDENPSLSPDGLTIWFTSGRAGNLDIWVATRAALGDTWGVPTRVDELSTGLALGASVSPSLLYMSIYKDSPRNLYESSRADVAQPWSAPARVDELATTGADRSGFFVSDTQLWFASERAGNLDIYRAQRAAPGEPYVVIGEVAGVNSTSVDDDPWLSPDGRTLFFMSSRSDSQQIWMATR